MMLGALELTDNFVWSDEFNYNQVEQSQERSLTGGMIIQEGQKLFGRPITLGPTWLPRSTLDALYAMESTPGAMDLTLPDGREFSVVFDRSRGTAVEAKPVHNYVYAANEADWQYNVTLRLLTVEP